MGAAAEAREAGEGGLGDMTPLRGNLVRMGEYIGLLCWDARAGMVHKWASGADCGDSVEAWG